MDVIERRQRVLELLEERGELTVADLSADFGVSEMTVRRDFDALEREQAIKRVRGGAISAVSRSYEPPFALRASRNLRLKAKLGRTAASMVSEGETVILDVGTTVLAVAEALVERRNITVVTSSLRAAWLLADNPELRVIVTGGAVRPGERSLVGAYSERVFEELYCDTFFMGVGGVDPRAGFTEYSLDDARIKQAALRSAKRSVVVAEASKLGKIAFARVGSVDAVDALVTDEGADRRVLNALRDLGIEIVTV